MNALATKTDDLPLAPIPAVAASPMLALIHDAIQKGMGIEIIRELKDMAKELAADEARRAFDAAMSDAKAEIPVIIKNRQVGYEHKDKSGTTSYRHEDLGEIARTVDPILAKHGLSYRFRTTSEPNQPIVVTCIVAHRAGHSEQNTLSAGRDDSGKKNSLQQIASTITYLQRYTLKAALGLAASADDDGAHADDNDDRISEDQVTQLRDLIEEVGADLVKFCRWQKVEALADIRQNDFKHAVGALEAKRVAK